MLISYKWLQDYFDEKLPEPERLAELFTFHFSEVEGIEQKGDDVVFNLKILPDRAHYALSHRGVARDIHAITGLKLKDEQSIPVPVLGKKTIIIKNDEPELCRRYIARMIEGITVKDSPQEITPRLEAISARSINSVVDAINYIMFDIGQPLHAFDADRVKGFIIIRRAKTDESIILLDGKEVRLSSEDLLIADDEGPLAVAGVKGGRRAEVTSATSRIIIESANFNPATVRKTSIRHNIRNDSSKRFESEITPHIAGEAMEKVSALILKHCGGNAGPTSDVGQKSSVRRRISTTCKEINDILGMSIPEANILDILARLFIKVEKKGNGLSLVIPSERLDLTISADIADEVGRIHGYDALEGHMPKKEKDTMPINKEFYYTEKIKDFFVRNNFSEIYGYSFHVGGKWETLKPFASDKAFLRENLRDGLAGALQKNFHFADLLNLDRIQIFEIGKVFPENGERLSLSFAVKNKKSDESSEKDNIKNILEKLTNFLGSPLPIVYSGETIVEIDLGTLFDALPEPKVLDWVFSEAPDIVFKPSSSYPYIVRDIALWVPDGASDAKVFEVIKAEVGAFMVNHYIFDVFKKDRRTSYAFRLVFQSFERTLTDDEINKIMEKITFALNSQTGWDVR